MSTRRPNIPRTMSGSSRVSETPNHTTNRSDTSNSSRPTRRVGGLRSKRGSASSSAGAPTSKASRRRWGRVQDHAAQSVDLDAVAEEKQSVHKDRAAAQPYPRKPGERADWQLVWEGEKKSHQISLRLLAVLAFAALAVLIVMTPLRAFVQQQEQIRELNSELDATKQHITELQESIALWQDPAYVEAQARDRLGYVMPGETLYSVTGQGMNVEDDRDARIEAANQRRRAATPFYVTMWDSIVVAGQSGEVENPQDVPLIK